MARMNANRFIPFGQPEKEDKTSDGELLKLAITLSAESGKLLESISNKDNVNSRVITAQLKQTLEQIISKLPSTQASNVPTSGYVAITGTTTSHEFKNLKQSQYPEFVKDVIKKSLQEKEEEFLQNSLTRQMEKKFDRHLDNGGLAPPQEWKSITEINLKASEKYNLVEEMRKLREQGKTIHKSNYHYKTPINIEEFTEPFKYLENMHDYNGSFLITLLKSDMEISNQANTLQVDLKSEKDACTNGDCIILSVYDITGSTSLGEEKKFMILLSFDKLHGTLKYSHPIFMNGKKCNLSTRQLVEVEKFCKAKKINLY